MIGLGYVGLPLALELAKQYRVIGFDINADRVEQMRRGIDPSKELDSHVFMNKDIEFTANPSRLTEVSFYIVAVPTPVSSARVPDLDPLIGASTYVGQYLKTGDIVVYESTVYPGCTEDDCVPVLERESGLQFGRDFHVGYSPERINPGDKEHTVDKILKIVSGSDATTLATISAVYGSVVTAGIYEAPSIKVAEAAKVIENSQRDLNISFVNELSMIFKHMNIDTQDVLDAAGTKWNFLPFRPGLVGGHCISVDPYYLIHKSKKLGYEPQVIASGRRVNDIMPAFVAKELVQCLIQQNKQLRKCHVAMLGVTFKENVADIRNSKVFDIYHELVNFGVSVDVTDPHADAREIESSYGIELTTKLDRLYDAFIVAVAHDEYKRLGLDDLRAYSVADAPLIVFDLKGVFDRTAIGPQEILWRL